VARGSNTAIFEARVSRWRREAQYLLSAPFTRAVLARIEQLRRAVDSVQTPAEMWKAT
jgi:hypothetical protein